MMLKRLRKSKCKEKILINQKRKLRLKYNNKKIGDSTRM